MNPNDGTNPFSDTAEQPPAIPATASSGLTGVGVTLLALSIVYIFLILTNLVVYVPMILDEPEDASFPITMCIYVAIIAAYNLVLITGAISILRRGTYIWAFITCCLAIVPFLGPCWILGIPVGIWGIVELRKQGVRETFKRS